MVERVEHFSTELDSEGFSWGKPLGDTKVCIGISRGAEVGQIIRDVAESARLGQNKCAWIEPVFHDSHAAGSYATRIRVYWTRFVGVANLNSMLVSSKGTGRI